MLLLEFTRIHGGEVVVPLEIAVLAIACGVPAITL